MLEKEIQGPMVRWLKVRFDEKKGNKDKGIWVRNLMGLWVTVV